MNFGRMVYCTIVAILMAICFQLWLKPDFFGGFAIYLACYFLMVAASRDLERT